MPTDSDFLNDHIALLQEAEAEIERLKRELALATAHDRQPYPTAVAYERVCDALEHHRTRSNQRREALQETYDLLCQFMTPSGNLQRKVHEALYELPRKRNEEVT